MYRFRQAVALTLVLALLLICVCLNVPVSAQNAFYTLTGTTLEEIHQEVDALFAHVLFTAPPTEDTTYQIVVRKDEHPVTYALLLEALNGDEHLESYMYDWYCEFMWNHPYNPMYLSANSAYTLNIYAWDSPNVYPDMMRFSIDYTVGDPNRAPRGVEVEARAFLRNELPEYPYPLNGTDLEKFQAINRYIALRCFYFDGSIPPAGPVTDEIAVDCFGYSGFGQYILRSAGYPTLHVQDMSYKMGIPGGSNHMWLNTFVDGYWYHVDFNANDTGRTDPASTSYGELCLLSGTAPVASAYLLPHPAGGQSYGEPKTKPPITQEGDPAGQLPPPLPAGAENYNVATPYLPVAAGAVVSAGPTSLLVTWDDVPGAEAGYYITYSADPPDAIVRAARMQLCVAGSTSALLTGLTTGVPYYVQLYVRTRRGTQGTGCVPMMICVPGGERLPDIPARFEVPTALTLPETYSISIGNDNKIRLSNYSPIAGKYVSPLAVLAPDNTSFTNVVWSVSDESIATFQSSWTYDPPRAVAYRDDGNTYLVGLKPGTVTLTAVTDHSKIVATCILTVTDPTGGPVPGDRALGDVDGSTRVDSTDARMVLQHEVGLIQLDDKQQTAADVDGSNTVDSTDARLILQFEVGLITKFPADD